MKSGIEQKNKFWAGGRHEFHRAEREINIGPEPSGWLNKLVRKIKAFLFKAIHEQIDGRLFIHKTGDK